MNGAERDDLFSAVLETIGRIERNAPTRAEFTELRDTVTVHSEVIEEIRRNSKGANHWGKIATFAAAVAPVVVGVAKAVGWY